MASERICRIDGCGNPVYRKSVCRYHTHRCWHKRKPKSHEDRKNNRFLTAFGQTKIMEAWAKERGIPSSAISRRIKEGWPVELAIFVPVKRRKA